MGINIAIVGFDHPHVLRYAPSFARHPGCRLSAIVPLGTNTEPAKKTAKDLGSAFYPSLESFLERERPNGVYVASEPRVHLKVYETLAPLRIAVMMDKPIALGLEEATKILELSRAYGARFMVPFNPPHQSGVQRAKETLNRGELGEMRHLSMLKFGKHPALLKGLDASWLMDPDRAGFGGFGDIGIHAVYTLLWLTGKKVVRVAGQTHQAETPRGSLDDVGTALFEMEDGSTASLMAGWANPSGNPAGLEARFELLCSMGVFLATKPYVEIELADRESMVKESVGRPDIEGLTDAFIKGIEGVSPMPHGGGMAKEALEVVLAVYRSSQSGRPVTLPLNPEP